MSKIKVLIAGIAGASLGTEILKCLNLIDNYEIFGCDISNLAYGLYKKGFIKTFCIHKSLYIQNILEICKENKIKVIIPGAEEPTLLLSAKRNLFEQDGSILLVNHPDVIDKCSDKTTCFNLLAKNGIRVPLSATAENFDSIFVKDIPCVVKPSTGSGGSSFVFLARNKNEVKLYSEYLIHNNQQPIIQEYISHDEGEFTVGTLRLGNKVGSIALKRTFNNKLSILQKSDIGLISTGYSQGKIDNYYEVRQVCEKIAIEIGSTGPLNIQGRLKDGEFVPFEINPRFSASTYLRSLAGFNEVDLFIRYLIGEQVDIPRNIKCGYYLRSLTEKYISDTDLK